MVFTKLGEPLSRNFLRMRLLEMVIPKVVILH